MPWFNVDDGFADHPKVLKLQSEDGWQAALSLWTLAGSWSSKHLTDGAISKVVVARLGCTPKDAELLVECGLWERSPDGYIFHDWLSRNPSRAQVEAKRERTRDRVTKHRRNGVTDSVTQPVTTGVTNAAGNGVSNTTPILSSPIQSNPKGEEPARGPAQAPKHPLRLKPVLEEAVRSEFGKRAVPRQGAGADQWLEACKRVDDALTLGRFPDAYAACEALAKVAVADSLKPGGKLGFALQQSEFVAARRTSGPPVTRTDILEDT